jgi:hypothetical protein
MVRSAATAPGCRLTRRQLWWGLPSQPQEAVRRRAYRRCASSACGSGCLPPQGVEARATCRLIVLPPPKGGFFHQYFLDIVSFYNTQVVLYVKNSRLGVRVAIAQSMDLARNRTRGRASSFAQRGILGVKCQGITSKERHLFRLVIVESIIC